MIENTTNQMDATNTRMIKIDNDMKVLMQKAN